MKEDAGKDKAKERIKELEEELRTTKYNKKTQHAIGLLKAKIARLKDKEETKARSVKRGEGYSIQKTGDATVIMVGYPSVGKSTLLNALTNAKSQIGYYDFTTLDVVPGLLEYKHAKIQLLDVPGIVEGAASGRGRGKEVLACAMAADLILIIIDTAHPEHLKRIQKELYDMRIRINYHPLDVIFKKTGKGGLDIGKTVKLPKLNKETIKGMLIEMKIHNAELVIREEIDADQLIDAIEGNRRYVPGIIVLNKTDLISEDKLKTIKENIKPDVCISAEKNIGIDELKESIFTKLNFMRVFCKQVGKKADMEEPLVIKNGDNIRRVCEKLHRGFIERFRFARVWGDSVKYDGQKILKLDHKLKDNDVVELHLR